MFKRTRRLRKNDIVRRLVRETRLSAEALVYPLFITEAGTDGSAAKEHKGFNSGRKIILYQLITAVYAVAVLTRH